MPFLEADFFQVAVMPDKDLSAIRIFFSEQICQVDGISQSLSLGDIESFSNRFNLFVGLVTEDNLDDMSTSFIESAGRILMKKGYLPGNVPAWAGSF